MAKRIILGGILGGIVLFLWQSVSHLVLPLGEMGIKRIGNEDGVVAALRQNIQQPGFYFFPAADTTPGMSKGEKQEAMRRAEEKYRTGPNGILIFHPQGGEALSPRQLLTRLEVDVTALLVGAFLLAHVSPLVGFGSRLLFVTLLGLLPGLVVNLPYWNWYGFPTNYTVAQLADHVMGFLAAGLVLAGLVKPRS